MLRKVKALPMSVDIGSFISFQNKFDFGVSYRTSASFSFMAYINVLGNSDIGYAYEIPSNTELSGQNINAHEIFFRIKLGEGREAFNQNDASDNGETP